MASSLVPGRRRLRGLPANQWAGLRDTDAEEAWTSAAAIPKEIRDYERKRWAMVEVCDADETSPSALRDFDAEIDEAGLEVAEAFVSSRLFDNAGVSVGKTSSTEVSDLDLSMRMWLDSNSEVKARVEAKAKTPGYGRRHRDGRDWTGWRPGSIPVKFVKPVVIVYPGMAVTDWEKCAVPAVREACRAEYWRIRGQWSRPFGRPSDLSGLGLFDCPMLDEFRRDPLRQAQWRDYQSRFIKEPGEIVYRGCAAQCPCGAWFSLQGNGCTWQLSCPACLNSRAVYNPKRDAADRPMFYDLADEIAKNTKEVDHWRRLAG